MVTIVPLTNWISGVAMSSAAPKPADEPSTPTGETSNIGAAAHAGDLEAVERHLANGAAVDAMEGETGASPLTMAALAGRAEAVELLIRRGANVNAVGRDRGTALHGAAFLGHEKTVETLVEHGANVNAANARGETPLDLAVVDEKTTLFFASLFKLKVDENGLEARKAAVADYLRRHGATAGEKAGLAGLLMQLPVFSHLWFLWFLWWLVLGTAALSALAARLPSVRAPARLIASPARYLWLIPLTMLPQSYMGDAGATPLFGPDTSTGLLPIPHVFAYYAIFFGFGALYFGVDDQSGRVGARWWLPLAVALLVVLPTELALISGWAGPPSLGLDPSTRRVISIGLQAAYPWLTTFGLMGLFRRFCAAESPRMRYLSDSAYWLYLAHPPLVIAAQYVVRDWPVPAPAKFLLIVVVVTAFLLWTYQTLVRYTWLGRFLNGPRERPGSSVMIKTG